MVVGRGCLGRPWLFRDLDLAFMGHDVPELPALGVVVDAMRTHVRLLADEFGDENNAVRDFRKHVGWYLTGYPIGGEPRRVMALASTIAELDALLDQLDPSLVPPRRGAARQAGPQQRAASRRAPRSVARDRRRHDRARQAAEVLV